MKGNLRVTVLAIVMTCFLPGASAQDAIPDKQLGPEKPRSVEQRERLFSAALDLQKHIDSMPEPTRRTWVKYLNWDAWGPMLLRNETPDRDTLSSVLPRFYGFSAGLDAVAMLRMRGELKSHLDGAEPPVVIGDLPSVYVRLDRAIVDNLLAKKSKTTERRQETGNWIAGAWVTGDAHASIGALARLVSHQEQAAIEVRVSGTIAAPNTISQSGRFHVHGSANSQVDGVVYLTWNEGKFQPGEPQLSVNTNSQLSHVDGPIPFRRLAMRVARKRQPQGEVEGAEIIRRSVIKEFKKELAEEVAQINQKVDEHGGKLAILKALDIVPNSISTALVNDKLELGLRYSDSGALQAPESRRFKPDSAFDVTLHETVLSAFPRKFLKGDWWSAERFSELQRDISGKKLDEYFGEKTNEPVDGWGARWDWSEPVRTLITKEHIECRLAFSHARMGNQWTSGGLLVSAKFKPVSNEGQLAFQRIGEVDVKTKQPNTELSIEETAFYKKQFEEICGESIPVSSLSPPAGVSLTLLSLFTSSDAELEAEWMNMSFRRNDEKLALGLIGQTQPATKSP
jgi:hypothetical protein